MGVIFSHLSELFGLQNNTALDDTYIFLSSVRISSDLQSMHLLQTRPSNPSTITRSTVNLRYGAGEEETKERKRSKVERRKTISSYDDVMENRDLPRFENASGGGGGTGSRSRSVMYSGSSGGGGHRESVSIRSDASSRGT